MRLIQQLLCCRIIEFAILVVVFSSCSTQTSLSGMHRISVLPENVHETSGLVYYNGYLFTLNDGGNAASVYGCEFGKYQNNTEISITTAQNEDWEALSLYDSLLVVADIGNNYNTRDTFTLYFLPIQTVATPSLLLSEQVHLSVTTTPENRISQKSEMIPKFLVNNIPVASQPNFVKFTIPNKPKAENQLIRSAFDMEAAVQIGRKFFVFTKNWDTEQSLVYNVSCTQSGEARLCDTLPFKGLVTSACNMPDSLIAFVGYHSYVPFVAICKWNNEGLSLVTIRRFRWHWACQTEGICYVPGFGLVISAEKTQLREQALYRVEIEYRNLSLARPR